MSAVPLTSRPNSSYRYVSAPMALMFPDLSYWYAPEHQTDGDEAGHCWPRACETESTVRKNKIPHRIIPPLLESARSNRPRSSRAAPASLPYTSPYDGRFVERHHPVSFSTS